MDFITQGRTERHGKDKKFLWNQGTNKATCPATQALCPCKCPHCCSSLQDGCRAQALGHLGLALLQPQPTLSLPIAWSWPGVSRGTWYREGRGLRPSRAICRIGIVTSWNQTTSSDWPHFRQPIASRSSHLPFLSLSFPLCTWVCWGSM